MKVWFLLNLEVEGFLLKECVLLPLVFLESCQSFFRSVTHFPVCACYAS